MEPIAIVLFLVILVAAVLTYLLAIHPLLRVSVETGTNHGEAAKERFLELLERASREVIIHDDGDRVADSIYENPEVVRAAEAACDRGIAVRCLFNYDEGLAFTRALSGKADIMIRKSPSLGSHYKIADYKVADRGTLAYLSWHGRGETTRRFRRIDCDGVPRYRRDWTARTLLGDYVEAFENAFAAGREPSLHDPC